MVLCIGYGRSATASPTRRWHHGDQRRVDSDWAHRGGATWRAERSISARQGLVEKGGVVLTVLLLVVGKIAFPVNRPNAAIRFARTAVHALIGVDVHRSDPLINAVGGALLHARLVHYIHTCATDHVGHEHQATQPLSAIAPAEGPLSERTKYLFAGRALRAPSLAGADDDHRNIRRMGYRRTHRTQKHPGKSAAAMAADHHQLSVLGLLE